MYGSPLASGYGAASDLFQVRNVAPNVERYARWLWESHTPLLAVALVAPFVVARRALAGLALAFASTTIVLYLPYRVFDDWWYIRFLLPAIPFLIVLSAAAIRALVGRVSPRAEPVVIALFVAALAALWVETARTRHAFDLRDWERHFIDAGGFAADHLPPNAAVLTVKHSGSVQYYSQRTIVAWDTLDAGSLDGALAFLRDRGFTPVLLLDTEEEPAFRARFEAASVIGRLDWPPFARPARTVRVYDPADRARYWIR